MSYPSDPGGTFSSGPSTSPVLSEPQTLISQGNPTGPAPSTGPLQAYVDAKASTDAQKANLLSSIATLGSVGKQAYIQQQQQNNAARASAISGITAAQGMVGTPTGVSQALSSAFAGQQQASTQQQSSLDNYQGAIAGGASNYYNQVGAAIPIMQERTAQQVNSFYAAQRAQAQKDAVAAQQAALQAEYTKQSQAMDLQIKQLDLQKAQASINGTLSPSEQIDLLNLGKDKNAQTFQSELTDKINAMNAIPDASGVKHGDKFRNFITGMIATINSSQGKATSPDPTKLAEALVNKAEADGGLNNVVDKQVLLDWLDAYYSGVNSGWRDVPSISHPGVGGPGYMPPGPPSISDAARASDPNAFLPPGQAPYSGPAPPAWNPPGPGSILPSR